MTRTRSRYIALASLAVVLVLGWFLYAPALSGTFLLDDQSNLGALKRIDGWESAVEFVASGDAGPVGRPLALASFLPQASSMESGPRAFLQFNILLHLFNAALLACFFHQLCLARRIEHRTALFVAVASAAVWLFMPLLATASLMVVQRMTTLSATFMFLGLIGYLWSRASIDERPGRALIGMSASLIAGTVLAVLSKENGALLPTLVLAMEATILERPRTLESRRWRAWTLVFLVVPTISIVAYLATAVPYGELTVLKRNFSGWERLLTETRILWEYLLNAFVPRPAQFGPFHDGHPVARTILDPITFAAFFGWVVTLGLAIAWRRRYPVVAFAVLWFVGGHLLESSVLKLELYFEHRNYVPIVGPVFALCFLAARAPIEKKGLVYAGLGLYGLVNAAVLVGLTTLWGQPAVAAHLWHERHPASVRATTHLASYELAIHGQEKALRTLDEFVRQHPDDSYLRIQELRLECLFSPQANHQETLGELIRSLPNSDFDYISATALRHLANTVDETPCNGMDLEAVKRLARTLISNPRYGRDPLYNQMHHQVMAHIARQQGDYGEAIRHLEKADQAKPDAHVNAILISMYATTGRYEEARRFIESAREGAPLHPLKRYEWMSILDDFDAFLREVQSQSSSEDQR